MGGGITMFLRVILSHFTQEIIFLFAIIANALKLTRKLTLGFKSNLKNVPYIARGDTIYSPSLAEGAKVRGRFLVIAILA